MAENGHGAVAPDPEGCKRPVGFAHYEVCYAGKDACGGDLTKIEGAHIEVLSPGECEYKRVAFVEYPERFVKLDFFMDGQYAVRHVTVGTCTEGEPSDAVPVSIDLTPPEKSPKGKVIIPCPQ